MVVVVFGGGCWWRRPMGRSGHRNENKQIRTIAGGSGNTETGEGREWRRRSKRGGLNGRSLSVLEPQLMDIEMSQWGWKEVKGHEEKPGETVVTTRGASARIRANGVCVTRMDTKPITRPSNQFISQSISQLRRQLPLGAWGGLYQFGSRAATATQQPIRAGAELMLC